jgi:hypothetical protein
MKEDHILSPLYEDPSVLEAHILTSFGDWWDDEDFYYAADKHDRVEDVDEKEKMQQLLRRCMFTWLYQHPEQPYHQGLSSIMAVVLAVLLDDSIESLDDEEEEAEAVGGELRKKLLDSKFIEYDAFLLFDALMKRFVALLGAECNSDHSRNTEQLSDEELLQQLIAGTKKQKRSAEGVFTSLHSPMFTNGSVMSRLDGMVGRQRPITEELFPGEAAPVIEVGDVSLFGVAFEAPPPLFGDGSSGNLFGAGGIHLADGGEGGARAREESVDQQDTRHAYEDAMGMLCSEIEHNLLGKMDPGLQQHLRALGVQAIDYLPHWVFSLLSHQFSAEGRMLAWDWLLEQGQQELGGETEDEGEAGFEAETGAGAEATEGPTSGFLQLSWLCTAMLLRQSVRSRLMALHSGVEGLAFLRELPILPANQTEAFIEQVQCMRDPQRAKTQSSTATAGESSVVVVTFKGNEGGGGMHGVRLMHKRGSLFVDTHTPSARGGDAFGAAIRCGLQHGDQLLAVNGIDICTGVRPADLVLRVRQIQASGFGAHVAFRTHGSQAGRSPTVAAMAGLDGGTDRLSGNLFGFANDQLQQQPMTAGTCSRMRPVMQLPPAPLAQEARELRDKLNQQLQSQLEHRYRFSARKRRTSTAGGNSSTADVSWELGSAAGFPEAEADAAGSASAEEEEEEEEGQHTSLDLLPGEEVFGCVQAILHDWHYYRWYDVDAPKEAKQDCGAAAVEDGEAAELDSADESNGDRARARVRTRKCGGWRPRPLRSCSGALWCTSYRLFFVPTPHQIAKIEEGNRLETARTNATAGAATGVVPSEEEILASAVGAADVAITVPEWQAPMLSLTRLEKLGQQQKSNSTASKVKSRMGAAVNLFNSWGSDDKPMRRGSSGRSGTTETDEDSSSSFSASLDTSVEEDDGSSVFMALDDDLGLGDEVAGEEIASPNLAISGNLFGAMPTDTVSSSPPKQPQLQPPSQQAKAFASASSNSQQQEMAVWHVCSKDGQRRHFSLSAFGAEGVTANNMLIESRSYVLPVDEPCIECEPISLPPTPSSPQQATSPYVPETTTTFFAGAHGSALRWQPSSPKQRSSAEVLAVEATGSVAELTSDGGVSGGSDLFGGGGLFGGGENPAIALAKALEAAELAKVIADGWSIFNPKDEYQRANIVGAAAAGLVASGRQQFRLVDQRPSYWVCPTYPGVFAVPAAISDNDLKKISEFRSKGRMPVAVWRHPVNGAVLSRCAQPKGGIAGIIGKGKRCREDEKLFLWLAGNSGAVVGGGRQQVKKSYIVDARSKLAATGNAVMGKGTESAGNYIGLSVLHMKIGNIHAVRNSYNDIVKLCQPQELSTPGTPGGGSRYVDDKWP